MKIDEHQRLEKHNFWRSPNIERYVTRPKKHAFWSIKVDIYLTKGFLTSVYIALLKIWNIAKKTSFFESPIFLKRSGTQKTRFLKSPNIERYANCSKKHAFWSIKFDIDLTERSLISLCIALLEIRSIGKTSFFWVPDFFKKIRDSKNKFLWWYPSIKNPELETTLFLTMLQRQLRSERSGFFIRTILQDKNWFGWTFMTIRAQRTAGFGQLPVSSRSRTQTVTLTCWSKVRHRNKTKRFKR